MADIREADLNAVADVNYGIVIVFPEKTAGSFGIRHRIGRHEFRLASPLAFPVPPFCFEFLDMRRVKKHDAAQIGSRVGRQDRTLEAVFDKDRQVSRVVDMGMRYEHVVEFTRADRNRNIDEIVSSLLHSAVDKNLFPRRLQVMTAPCNLMVRSDKCQFHVLSSSHGLQINCIYYIITAEN